MHCVTSQHSRPSANFPVFLSPYSPKAYFWKNPFNFQIFISAQVLYGTRAGWPTLGLQVGQASHTWRPSCLPLHSPLHPGLFQKSVPHSAQSCVVSWSPHTTERPAYSPSISLSFFFLSTGTDGDCLVDVRVPGCCEHAHLSSGAIHSWTKWRMPSFLPGNENPTFYIPCVFSHSPTIQLSSRPGAKRKQRRGDPGPLLRW